jgi:LSU ribosomal protein L24P
VEILRGDDAGEEAEVINVDLRSESITVEDVTVEKSDGEEVPRPLDASNLRVTELDLEDPRREQRLEEDNA